MHTRLPPERPRGPVTEAPVRPTELRPRPAGGGNLRGPARMTPGEAAQSPGGLQTRRTSATETDRLEGAEQRRPGLFVAVGRAQGGRGLLDLTPGVLQLTLPRSTAPAAPGLPESPPVLPPRGQRARLDVLVERYLASPARIIADFTSHAALPMRARMPPTWSAAGALPAVTRSNHTSFRLRAEARQLAPPARVAARVVTQVSARETEAEREPAPRGPVRLGGPSLSPAPGLALGGNLSSNEEPARPVALHASAAPMGIGAGLSAPRRVMFVPTPKAKKKKPGPSSRAAMDDDVDHGAGERTMSGAGTPSGGPVPRQKDSEREKR